MRLRDFHHHRVTRIRARRLQLLEPQRLLRPGPPRRPAQRQRRLRLLPHRCRPLRRSPCCPSGPSSSRSAGTPGSATSTTRSSAAAPSTASTAPAATAGPATTTGSAATSGSATTTGPAATAGPAATTGSAPASPAATALGEVEFLSGASAVSRRRSAVWSDSPADL